MVGYRNAVYNPHEKTVDIFTWSDDGNRITTTVPYLPYFFVEDTKGAHTSIFNTKLKKKVFNNIFEKNKYLKDTGARRVYENFNPVQQTFLDMYWEHNETDEFSKFPLKIYYLDIEAVAESFPDPMQAQHTINVITIFDTISNKFYTWGLEKYNNKDSQVVYYHCRSEKELLYRFIDFMKCDPPDILSGWNSSGFDIPYIINRIRNVLGEEDVNRLSPGNRVTSRVAFNDYGRETQIYRIEGISCVDYLLIYKKFSFSNKESYKLDYIGEIELDEKKIDYGDTSLFDLMQNDWDTFVDYNIQDVRLLVKLEEKLQYNNLLRMLAYVGCTTFEGAMGTSSIVTGAAAIRARQRDQKLATFIRSDEEGKNPGAFVAQPVSGFQHSVVSFDANSLYPNVMISLNMSPETKIGSILKIEDNMVCIRHTNGQLFNLSVDKFKEFIHKENIAVSKAKVLFSQKTKGIFPDLMDYYYNKRKEVQAELKECKKLLSQSIVDAIKVEKLKQRSSNLHAKQLCIKIFINSIYGLFGNKKAPIGDDQIASSITLTGQAVIKQAREIAKDYISKYINTNIDNLEDVAIYSDTDSLYLSLKKLPIKFSESGSITEECYEHAHNLESKLNQDINTWAKRALNSADCRFVFKRESMIDTALFLEKKRYVAHVLDDEGIPCDKWKYTGVDIVRTTMPKAIKPYAKKIVETMLTTQSISDTNKVVREAYDVFSNLDVEDISKVTGISKLEHWASLCKDFNTKKGMPFHVKAAYYYNLLLDKLELNNKYEKIVSGDKIKVFNAQTPNKYGIKHMAFKNTFPEEFKHLILPDRSILFDKIIYSLVERFYTAVNWQPRKPTQQVRNELADIFG